MELEWVSKLREIDAAAWAVFIGTTFAKSVSIDRRMASHRALAWALPRAPALSKGTGGSPPAGGCDLFGFGGIIIIGESKGGPGGADCQAVNPKPGGPSETATGVSE
jgi:hypothetical protein